MFGEKFRHLENDEEEKSDGVEDIICGCGWYMCISSFHQLQFGEIAISAKDECLPRGQRREKVVLVMMTMKRLGISGSRRTERVDSPK